MGSKESSKTKTFDGNKLIILLLDIWSESRKKFESCCLFPFFHRLKCLFSDLLSFFLQVNSLLLATLIQERLLLGYRSPDASFGDFSCLKFAYDPWLSFYVILISLHPSDVSHRQLSKFYFFFIWLSGMLTPNSLWKIGGSWGEILLSSNLGHSTSWQLHELGHFEPQLKKLSIEVPMIGTDEWSSIKASLAIKFWPIVDFPSLWGETFTSISFLSYTCLKNPVYLQS